jgi:predicted methyltransferase
MKTLKPSSPRTISEVNRAVLRAKSPAQLLEILTEEHMFHAGEAVYIAGSMGQCNVDAVFQKMNSGGYATVKTSQGVFHVSPQKLYPKSQRGRAA